MARTRRRPPRLEPAPHISHDAPPPSLEDQLVAAKVAGGAAGSGPARLRSLVAGLVAGDRAALGALAPVGGLTADDCWRALATVFGASPHAPGIDPARTVEAAARAAARVRAVAAAGGEIALATASPATLLTLHLALARHARAGGGVVVDRADVGPRRADGRSPRWVRGLDGVAAVTDGRALLATGDADTAREWLFVVGRPALVVADGVFAEAAWEAGLDVVAFAGLDRGGLALPATRGERCLVVPLRADRPPRAYRPVLACFEAAAPAVPVATTREM